MDRQQQPAQVGLPAAPDRGAAAMLGQALAHHRAGRLAEAERLYRQVLELDPHHGDALHLLGMLAGQSGRHDTAAELIRRAIAVNGGQPYYHLHLGLAARNLGRLDEAEASYRRALDLKSDLVEAHHGLGMVLQAFGRHG
jgi:Flp pilus assembly protein TadD